MNRLVLKERCMRTLFWLVVGRWKYAGLILIFCWKIDGCGLDIWHAMNEGACYVVML